MFEAIRFVLFFKTKDLIIYENFPDNEKERINVVFYLKIKQIRVYYVETDEDVFINMPLLKAINKQCEEFGWLDKLTIMDELIEKEKMGKPSHITYSKKENKFIGVCRKCHQIVNQKMNYCCSCGKRKHITY